MKRLAEPQSAVLLAQAIARFDLVHSERRPNGHRAPSWPIARADALVGVDANSVMYLALSGSPEAPGIIARRWGDEGGEASVSMTPEEDLLAIGALTREGEGLRVGGGFEVMGISSVPQQYASLIEIATSLRSTVIRQRRRQARERAQEELPLAAGGRAVYVGFGMVSARSAYTLAQLHALVDAAVSQTSAAWAWSPSLYVTFFRSKQVMGRASDPGGDDRRRRHILLSSSLLQHHSSSDVVRTVIHELCHHYREERWPRARRFRRSDDGSHDDIFCKTLSQIDPAAGSPEHCRYFVSDVDLSQTQ